MPAAEDARALRRAGGGLRYGAASVAAILLVLVVGALRDATESLHGMLGSALWTTVGPHFVLLSLLALGLGIYAFRGARRRLAILALSLACCATLGSVFITGQIVSATRAAGGTVSLFAGLLLRSMTAGGPDETAIVATVDSRPLQAARQVSPTRPPPVILSVMRTQE